MDALRAILKQKKEEKKELVGDKKQLRRSELEEARLKRIREEEEQERLLKEQKRQKQQPASGSSGGGQVLATTADASKSQQQEAASTPALPRAEVIRRLRALGQPATLFAEEDAGRLARLRRVEKEVVLLDEARGGGENSLLQLKRQEKLSKQKGGTAAAAADGKAAGGSAAAAARGTSSTPGKAPPPGTTAAADAEGAAAGPVLADGSAAAQQQQQQPPAPGTAGQSGASGPSTTNGMAAGGGAGGSEQQALEASFAQAAALLAKQRAEEALDIEDRILRQLQQWCDEWGADLDARPEEVKASGAGHQATMVYRQSMEYMKGLYWRLKRRSLEEELRVGLWMIVEAMRARNYLEANDVYLRLAIGNAAWPIGVTSVGIHERSAREKISHVMNTSGQAHIMNDEASRKYFQAIKRLMTNLQRLYPTDPSRSVDFNLTATEGLGRGIRGGGSDKAALLAAEANGELPLALPAAPHHIDKDGSVRIPPKWENILAREAEKVQRGGAGGMGPPKTPPRGTGSAPKTPPRPVSPAGVN